METLLYQEYLGIVTLMVLILILIDNSIKIKSKTFVIIMFVFLFFLYVAPTLTNYYLIKNVLNTRISIIYMAAIVVMHIIRYKSSP